jgi:hypothetical protein
MFGGCSELSTSLKYSFYCSSFSWTDITILPFFIFYYYVPRHGSIEHFSHGIVEFLHITFISSILCACSHFITVCSMIFPRTSLPYPLMIFHHVAAGSWATFWPILISCIQNSLQWSSLVPSAFWGVVFISLGSLWHGIRFVCCIQFLL